MNPQLEVNGQMTDLKAQVQIVMDAAVRWIEANQDKLFAALIHFREPHLPYTPMPEEDARLFKKLDPTIPDVKGLDREQVKQFYRDYYAVVHAVDRNLGKLLAVLERLKLDHRTIVIFQSDHGYNFAFSCSFASGICGRAARRVSVKISASTSCSVSPTIGGGIPASSRAWKNSLR